MGYLLKRLSVDPAAMLHVTYVEIYQEAVFDLLASHEDKLPVKWSSKKGFYVYGAKQISCRDMDSIHMVRTLLMSKENRMHQS